MRNSIYGRLLLVGVCLIAGTTSQVQQQQNYLQPGIDVAVVYHPLLAHQVSNDDFWMQGGSVQLHTMIWHGLGVVADVSGVHESSMNGTGVGLDLVTVTFGPRYTWAPPCAWSPRVRWSASHTWSAPALHYALFGQILAGQANGLNGVFPHPSGATGDEDSLALSIGGGINVPLQHRLTVRAIEVDWLRTQLPNGTSNVQNNLRLGTGLAYQF